MDSYLHQNFVFKLMTEEVVSSCPLYSCSKDEHIDKFFHSEFMDYDRQMLGKSYCFVSRQEPRIAAAFTVANSSVRVDNMPKSKRNKLNRKIPFSKQRSQYPAVLIAQLAVFDDYRGRNLGEEVLNFIKSWFIDPLNKTGCRYIVVDAVNNPKVLQFYLDNGFDFIFSSDLEEMQYMSKAVQIDEADLYRETRLMVFDLMSIRSKV
jgi:GNAT superfamily N-acetyltransferase